MLSNTVTIAIVNLGICGVIIGVNTEQLSILTLDELSLYILQGMRLPLCYH